MAEFVTLEIGAGADEGIGTIRLARPPMNALDTQMQEELREAAVLAADDPRVRAVVLYGGPKVFAAGADIKEMVGMSYPDMLARAGRLSSAFAEVARIGKPVVAAIAGYALGGGCELALCADFRVAGANARLGQPEILLGLIPGAGGTQRLPRLIGPSKAKELIFSGRMVDADEALRLGLVDVVVAPDDVYSSAKDYVRRFTAGPAQALRLAKEAVDLGLEHGLEAGLRLESQLFAATFATEDRTIGMASFLADGPGRARFVGR